MEFIKLKLKNKTWKTLIFIVPLTIILFSYQQCSRSCDIEINRVVGSNNLLPFCSIDNSVACVNDFKSCGDHSDSTKWYTDTTNVIPKDRVCKYGETVIDNYTEQAEYTCKDGSTTPTGVTKEGPVKDLGQCSDVPFNCGPHMDGTKWWESDPTLQKIPRVCAQPSPDAFNYYNSENEFTCVNGKIISTDQKRLTTLNKADNCLGENNCLTHTEGAVWYENKGTIQVPRICNDVAKTPVVDIYVNKKELKCDKGIPEEQPVTLRGDLLSYGECPETVNCGNYHDGETWKVVTDEVIVENYTCSDKLTPAETRYAKIQVKQCINGIITVKDSIKGNLLSSGICPRAGCAPYLDGERWLVDLGLEIIEPKKCPYGPTEPTPTISYVNLQEAICNNGATNPTGYLQPGDKKKESTCYTCAPSSKKICPKENASGYQTCKLDGTGYGECQLDHCNPGFYNKDGACLAQICTPGKKYSCDSSANSKGSKICNEFGSNYGACSFESCNSGYVKVPDGFSLDKNDNNEKDEKDNEDKDNKNKTKDHKKNKVKKNHHGRKDNDKDDDKNDDKEKSGMTKTVTKQVEMCQKIICAPDSLSSTGCASLKEIPGGFYQQKCNSFGTQYLQCALSCKDGSTPKDGMCLSYHWAPSTKWSSCDQDCGGSQVQEFTCANNLNEAADNAKCTMAKPIVSRICNSKNTPWTEGVEQVTPATREVCPGLYLGYIEKTFQKTINFSCVDNKKIKTLSEPVLLATHNYCSAIQPARCSHDSLSIPESLGRLSWMKVCQDKVPVIKSFFETIGGADQLSKYLNDTNSSMYGKDRPRPLYVTFSDQKNVPWIAPKSSTTKSGATSCEVPADIKVFGICTSSCYTPDQKLLFDVAGKPKYVPILEAINQKQESIMSLTSNSVLEKLKFEASPIAHFVSELVDTNHKIRNFITVSGGKLSVTFNHPLVASDGVIREASDFKVGDQLIRANGKFDEISSIEDVVYTGKVHNVLPYSESTTGNIIVAEGFLSGSAYYQNDGMSYMNQQVLRHNLLNGIDLKK